MIDPNFDVKALKDWFNENKRSLPWRDNPSPYAVWVSEIMLQQTQVAVVIPYFNRWMHLFPTIKALAESPLDLVIKAWEGLGYYSRARNLHAGACMVLSQYDGKLPSEALDLTKVKGVGPYTVGAIRSFAFHQKAAAVDGNVMRVLARYFHIEEDLCKPKTIKKIWQLAEEILPENESWILTEGLIELGATVCTKKPKCLDCPLKNSCQAFVQQDADELPFKSAKMKAEKLYRAVAVVQNTIGKFLIKYVESGNVMSGLHEFPYFESPLDGIESEELTRQIKKKLGLRVVWKEEYPKIQHSFTRYQVSLFPHSFHCHDEFEVNGFRWMSSLEMKKVAFSSGHRRLYEMLLN